MAQDWRSDRGRLAERLVMAGAASSLIMLVVLPIGSRLVSSMRGDAGFSLKRSPGALSGRLYITAPVNALILGADKLRASLAITLPTRICALFDFTPQYGLASVLPLIFILITVAALRLQTAPLSQRLHVTIAGRGYARH